MNRHVLPGLSVTGAVVALAMLSSQAQAVETDEAVAVGATGASLEVDQQGGVSYRIPIAVAPGPGGLQPSLALVYGSHSGDGPLGVGWAIEGLSAIHRCAAIAPLHGERGRVDLSADDQLCIDGRFLTAVDGAAAPVQSRELHTRIESFTNITAGDDPATTGYTVRTREGQITAYGENADTRITTAPGGGVFSWLLNRIADRAGNTMHVHYAPFGAQGGNERHVERIDYGPGKVIFEYEPRTAPSTAYLAGATFPLTQRLVRIATHTGDLLVREYRFAYEDSDGVRPDRLTSVTECAEGGDCLRPTVFEWRESAQFELSRWGGVKHPDDRKKEHRRYRPGDFNGDGLTDIYEIHGSDAGAYDAIRINTGDGFFESVPGPWTEKKRIDDLSNFHFADFNGDGLTDIYQFRYREAHDKLYLTRLSQESLSFDEVEGIDSGTAGSPTIASGCVHRDCLRFGDFNGDGNTDVYRIRHRGAIALTDEVYLSNGDGSYERVAGIGSAAAVKETRAALQVGRIKIGDFNGDGITDIYRLRDGTAADAGTTDEVYLTLRPGEYRRVAGIKTQFNFHRGHRSQLLRIRFGDFNGDGVTDIYYVTPGARATADEVHLSHGDGRYTKIEAPGFVETGSGDSLQASLSRIVLGDFNADGRTDIYYLANGDRPDDVHLAANNGWQHRAGMTFSLGRGHYDQLAAIARLQFADFNGDGASDIYHLGDALKGEARIYVARPRVNLVRRITDGLGAGFEIRYESLIATPVHELAADTAPAAARRPPSFRVVAAVEVFGGGRTRVEHHRYGGARTDSSGFGFLGFAWKETRDPDRQLVTRTLYSQTFPYFGSALEQTIALENGATLSDTRTTYDALDLENGQTVFPYSVRSESRRYELDGQFVSMTTVAHSDYDEYGNAGEVETVTADNERRFEQVALYDYFNDREQWLLGGRVRAQTMYRDGVHTEITRVATADYDPQTGFLLSETSEPDDALAVVRSYEYDDFGNRLVEHAEPVGASAQAVSVRRTYDETGRFAINAVNAAGHTAAQVHDERFGQATLVVDANGLTTWREYDGWGRLIGETRPDATRTTITYSYELPENAAPPGSVYMMVEETTERPSRRTFHDAHGRLLGSQSVGFDGRTLFDEREYDRHGRLVRISLPHRDDEPVAWVERHYDSLDRLVEESSPLADGQVTTRWFNYRGAAVEHIDELGYSKVITRDAPGRVVGVREPLGAQMLFEHDPMGRVIKATDASEREVSMEYDAFGNRVQVVHPDQGLQRFVYDSFGRVARTIDAAGAERRMVYDSLGRLVKRDGPEGTAHWSYDTTGHGVGKLAQESYGGHARSFHYDDAGRIAAIDDHRGHVTEMSYASGHLSEVRYPRGFVVEHIYNEHGYLSAVRSPFFETGDFDTDTASGDPHDEAFYRGKADEYASRALFYERWATRLASADDDEADEDKDLVGALAAAAVELEEGAGRLRDEMTGAPTDGPTPAASGCERTVSTKLIRAERFLKDAREASARLRLHASGAASIERQMYVRMAFSEQMLDEVRDCLATMEPVADSQTEGAAEHVMHWRALAHDTVGRVVSEHTGDGWRTRRRYHTGNGYLQEIRSDSDAHGDVRHLVYDYDEVDNLVSRTDHTQDISEYFGYDELDRIVSAVVLSDSDHNDYNKAVFYRYDELGNFIFRSGVGDYDYDDDPSEPGMRVAGEAYEYDDSGNLISAPDFSAEWFSFGKPAFLEKNGARVEFVYDANGKRITKRASGGDITLYFDKFYEKTLKADGAVEHRHFIHAGERLIAIYYEKEDGSRVSRRLRYLHQDSVGSVDTITNAAGAIVERLSYTPFGMRRASNWRESEPVLPTLINRGFTGHEHLDEVSLVHMNGRVYDPHIGRFLSPDPYVPSPLSTQSHNRYSYAMNNPMKFTDPSGFFLKKIFKGIRRTVRKAAHFVRGNAHIIAAVAAGYYAGVWASNAFVKSAAAKLSVKSGAAAYAKAHGAIVAKGAVVGGAVSGGVSSALTGGNLRSVLANAAGGGALVGVGAHFGGQWKPDQVLSSAAINGATSAAAGGSFRDGALSGLTWGSLRSAAAAMRRAMVAQSLLNPENAGGLSSGAFGDKFKLGGGRYSVHGGGPSPLGGHQGGQGELFGRPYAPSSVWDRTVEAFAGPHDYLNSAYWYNDLGNIKSQLSTFQRHVGEVLNAANVVVAAPFAAATLMPASAASLEWK